MALTARKLNAVRVGLTLVVMCGMSVGGQSDPKVQDTEVIGPFTGAGAPLHPDNISPIPIHYYGTDLGFTYEHQGTLHIIFGDTTATEEGEVIEASTGRNHEDGFGTIDLERWGDGSSISSANIPLIRLGQNPGTNEMSAINPGQVMPFGRTPVGAFSNGKDQFALLFTWQPRVCANDEDCGGIMACDSGLGHYDVGSSSRFSSPLFPCVDGVPGCMDNPVRDAGGAPIEGSGICSDRSSSIWADTPDGRAGAAGLTLLVTTRSKTDPRMYHPDHEWFTNKFMNVALRTVSDFKPSTVDSGSGWNYRRADSGAIEAGDEPRVFLWGRPDFIGVNKTGRSLSMYFAHVPLPEGPQYSWNLSYFTGLDAAGRPRFSPHEQDAAAVDLDSGRPGVQTEEQYDVVNQVSIAWIEALDKWVMFYGGGVSTLTYPALSNCGILELFAGSECKQAVVGNGAFRMRTADHPWGPWSPAQDLIEGGDPADPTSGQYGPGGVLAHPGCQGEGCIRQTQYRDNREGDYGFFYAANIIEQWVSPVDGGVDVIWNASTWNPYRVILLRTRIDR